MHIDNIKDLPKFYSTCDMNNFYAGRTSHPYSFSVFIFFEYEKDNAYPKILKVYGNIEAAQKYHQAYKDVLCYRFFCDFDPSTEHYCYIVMQRIWNTTHIIGISQVPFKDEYYMGSGRFTFFTKRTPFLKVFVSEEDIEKGMIDGFDNPKMYEKIVDDGKYLFLIFSREDCHQEPLFILKNKKDVDELMQIILNKGYEKEVYMCFEPIVFRLTQEEYKKEFALITLAGSGGDYCEIDKIFIPYNAETDLFAMQYSKNTRDDIICNYTGFYSIPVIDTIERGEKIIKEYIDEP